MHRNAFGICGITALVLLAGCGRQGARQQAGSPAEPAPAAKAGVDVIYDQDGKPILARPVIYSGPKVLCCAEPRPLDELTAPFVLTRSEPKPVAAYGGVLYRRLELGPLPYSDPYSLRECRLRTGLDGLRRMVALRVNGHEVPFYFQNELAKPSTDGPQWVKLPIDRCFDRGSPFISYLPGGSLQWLTGDTLAAIVSQSVLRGVTFEGKVCVPVGNGGQACVSVGNR
jgi:hypothetical protein